MTGGGRHDAARHRRSVIWHRRVGLVIASLVVVIVATALPLNHIDRLGLDRRIVTSDALLDWYGMKPRGRPVSFRIGDDWLTWLGGALYLNDRPLDRSVPPIRGAVAVDGLVIVAAPPGLVVFTEGGTLVEKISAAGLPRPIEAIGLADGGRIALRTSRGPVSASADLLDWTPVTAPVDWVRPAAPPAALENAILRAWRGRGLPWSRLLLDIHTGRILGPWGPYLVDAASLALLFLVGTGLYNRLRVRK